MLGSDPGAAFTAIIQIGTELAVILYFRHDIINILTHWFSCLIRQERQGLEGPHGPRRQLRHTRLEHYRRLDSDYYPRFTLQNVIETSLRNLWITVTVLLVFGILLWMVDAKLARTKP